MLNILKKKQNNKLVVLLLLLFSLFKVILISISIHKVCISINRYHTQILHSNIIEIIEKEKKNNSIYFGIQKKTKTKTKSISIKK
jgi:hypothetical protein